MQVIPYLLVGFPEQSSFEYHLSSFLQNPSFPLVEVGLPEQRPYLDGAVIRSAQRHVRRTGLTFEEALRYLGNVSWGESARKVVLMGYLRDLVAFGVEAFAAKIHHAGFGGMILVGRRSEVLACGFRMTIPLVPVVTVKDTNSRLRPFFRRRPPFIYFRVSGGKTGEGGLFPLPLLRESLERLREAYPGIPVFAGFGISDRETACRLKEVGFSGVVVGSTLLERIMEKASLEDFLRELEAL